MVSIRPLTAFGLLDQQTTFEKTPMIRILDITLKDLIQLLRDFKTFMFLLIMPILFTFLFGFAFGGFQQRGVGFTPAGGLSVSGQSLGHYISS